MNTQAAGSGGCDGCGVGGIVIVTVSLQGRCRSGGVCPTTIGERNVCGSKPGDILAKGDGHIKCTVLGGGRNTGNRHGWRVCVYRNGMCTRCGVAVVCRIHCGICRHLNLEATGSRGCDGCGVGGIVIVTVSLQRRCGSGGVTYTSTIGERNVIGSKPGDILAKGTSNALFCIVLGMPVIVTLGRVVSIVMVCCAGIELVPPTVDAVLPLFAASTATFSGT